MSTDTPALRAYREAVKDMQGACTALFVAVEAEVAEDVRDRFVRLQNATEALLALRNDGLPTERVREVRRVSPLWDASPTRDDWAEQLCDPCAELMGIARPPFGQQQSGTPDSENDLSVSSPLPEEEENQAGSGEASSDSLNGVNR